MVFTYTLEWNNTGTFPNNTNYRFRVRTKNGVGFGAYSVPLTVTTDRTPLQPLMPTYSDVEAEQITISWTRLTAFEDTGRDPIQK